MVPQAILLIGPTASGKTPLGDALERAGLWGKRCVHFDFGAQLRAAAAEGSSALTEDDLRIVRSVLTSGALLEDHQFGVARRILRAFLAEHTADAAAMVVLNGLPRHVGQARDMAGDVQVAAVVVLDCSPEVVRARIRADSGSDRAERADDTPTAVARRLQTFHDRTALLVEHYRLCGMRVITLAVGSATSAEELREELERIGGSQPV